MSRLIKSVMYIGVPGVIGYVLMTATAPSDDELLKVDEIFF